MSFQQFFFLIFKISQITYRPAGISLLKLLHILKAVSQGLLPDLGAPYSLHKRLFNA